MFISLDWYGWYWPEDSIRYSICAIRNFVSKNQMCHFCDSCHLLQGNFHLSHTPFTDKSLLESEEWPIGLLCQFLAWATCFVWGRLVTSTANDHNCIWLVWFCHTHQAGKMTSCIMLSFLLTSILAMEGRRGCLVAKEFKNCCESQRYDAGCKILVLVGPIISQKYWKL